MFFAVQAKIEMETHDHESMTMPGKPCSINFVENII
jgi:hypothetical protein